MDTSNTPEKSRKIVSLRLQLLIGFTLIFTLVFITMLFWLYTFIDSVIIGNIRTDLENSVLGAAKGVDGDALIGLYRDGEPNAAGFSDDRRYDSLMNWMETVHSFEPRAWPYLFVRGDQPNQIFYVADLQAHYDPKRSAKFREENPNAPTQTRGLEELSVRAGDGRNGEFGVYTDPWGSWVSAYAPIYDKSGKPVGGIGLDFTADYVEISRKSVLNQIVIMFLITYTILFIMVWFVAGAFTRPIQRFTQVAEQIGEGDYNQDLSQVINRPMRDEISILAQVFTVMAGKVRQREQTLRLQVEELKIEINEAKKKAEVSEIVESEFFRD